MWHSINLQWAYWSSKLSQHIGGKCTEVMVTFSVLISDYIFLGSVKVFYHVSYKYVFLPWGYWVVQNIFWKIRNSGTSVRYQSFGCSASGHLENICTDRRSQKFLRLDEFLPQTLWHLLSSLCPPPPPPSLLRSWVFLGNVCLGSSQNQIQSRDCCVDTLQAATKYFKQLFHNLWISLWQAQLLTLLRKGSNSVAFDACVKAHAIHIQDKQ